MYRHIGKLTHSHLKYLEVLPKLLETEKSFCPFCGNVINSQIVEIFERVFLKKSCCGREMLYFLENDVDFFLNTKKLKVKENIPEATTYMKWFKNLQKDTHTLYLYTTLRCNLNCPICYLKFDGFLKDKSKIECDLPLNLIKKIVNKTSAEVIVFTGGEPTLHPNLPQAINYAKKKGRKVAILTNGLKLLSKQYLKTLADAGIDRIGLSFDGFDNYTYKLLRGKPLLKEKLKVLKNLKEFNIKVTLVSVIAKGINENEVPKIIRFAARNVQFINQIVFVSLRTKEFSSLTTAPSDVIKIVSKHIEGFEPKDIYLYTKFYYNLYRAIQKLLSGVLKENVIKKKTSFLIPGCDLLLKVEKGKTRLLFSTQEIENINHIVERIYRSKSRVGSMVTILKNIHIFTKLLFSKFSLNQLIQTWFRGEILNGYDVLDNSKNLLRIHFNCVKSIHTFTFSDNGKVKPWPPVISYAIVW